MPTSVVDISLSSSTGATAQETYNDICVIGHATSAPSAGFNTVKSYTSASDVESDFGANSDVHTASEALAEMGVSEWSVIVAEEKTVTDEVIDGSDSSALTNGAVDNVPVHDDASTLTVSVDGSDITASNLMFTVDDPSSKSPGAGEAYFNTDTGEVEVGDATSGSGDGIEVDYHHLDWSPVKTEIEPLGFDLVLLADTHFDVPGFGNLDEIVSWASSNDAGVVGASVNGDNESTEQDAMDIAHEVGGAVSSGHYMQVAHKSTDDVAAYIVGQLGVNEAWFDPFWDGDGYPFATNYYSRANVGDPSSAGTFEGGDASNQEGATNVVISVDGTKVLSNSLTTAGSSSNYQFFDVARTESFVASEIENALTSLRLSSDQIPYTPQGRSAIIGAIQGQLQEYVSGQGAPLSELDISAPTIDQISDSDKANRVFPNISVTGTLAGNVHEFSVDLNVQV